MQYYIDILSGTDRLGAGPLTSIQNWTVTRRIDRAGSFSFTLPAEDDKASIVASKLTAQIYANIGGAWRNVGGGVIDNIERIVNPDGTISLRVSGDDDLRELTYRTVGNLALFVTTVSTVWTERASITGPTTITGAAYNGATIVAGGDDGHIYTSANSGVTWTDRGQLGSETSIDRVWFDSGNFFYAVGSSGELYWTNSSGTFWSAVGYDYTPDAPFARAPTKYVMAIDANAYANSTKSGSLATWTDEGALGAEDSAPSIVVSDGVVLMGTEPNGKIFRSTDSGANWTDIGQLGSETTVVSLAANDTTVIAGTLPGGEIYRSTNSGSSWTYIAALASASTISYLRYIGDDTFIAGTGDNGKIYQSTDDGENWTEIADLTEAQVNAVLSVDTLIAVGSSSNTVWAQGSVSSVVATHAQAVDLLEILAPAGWTFVADATPATPDEIFITFAGESLLEAVLRLAEASETHLYLSASRTLTFTDTWSASGVHATNLALGAIPDATVAVITELSKREQTFDLITWIFPWGRDVNGDVAGIASTSFASNAFTGFTIYPVDNYIIYNAGNTTYGRIDRWVNYYDIRATTASDLYMMADSVVRAAIAELRRSNFPIINYDLDLAGCSTLLTPMTTLRVTYQGDGLTIDETLNIIETTWRGDATGYSTVGVVTSDTAYWIEDDAGIIAASMARVNKLAAR